MSQFVKVAVLIKEKNKFLLVQENGARVRGLWNWPQGRVEAGETIEQTAIREVKEETGLDIKIEKPLEILTNTFSDIKELHICLGSITGGKVDFPQNEIMDVQYFSFEEIEKIKDILVGAWVYEIIAKNKDI